MGWRCWRGRELSHPSTGDTGTAGGTRRAAARAPGAAGAAHASPACRSSTAHCDTSPTGLGRCPGVSPAPLWWRSEAALSLLSAAFLPRCPQRGSPAHGTAPEVAPRGTKVAPRLLGVTLGGDRAVASPIMARRGHLWSSVCPSQRIPVNPSHLEAQPGGLRCSGGAAGALSRLGAGWDALGGLRTPIWLGRVGFGGVIPCQGSSPRARILWGGHVPVPRGHPGWPWGPPAVPTPQLCPHRGAQGPSRGRCGSLGPHA